MRYAEFNKVELTCFSESKPSLACAGKISVLNSFDQQTMKEGTQFLPLATTACEFYTDWMTVNYRERYDIFSPRSVLFKHGIPLRRLKSVTPKFTDSGDTIKHSNWMFWSLAIWQ